MRNNFSTWKILNEYNLVFLRINTIYEYNIKMDIFDLEDQCQESYTTYNRMINRKWL